MKYTPDTDKFIPGGQRDFKASHTLDMFIRLITQLGMEVDTAHMHLNRAAGRMDSQPLNFQVYKQDEEDPRAIFEAATRIDLNPRMAKDKANVGTQEDPKTVAVSEEAMASVMGAAFTELHKNVKVAPEVAARMLSVLMAPLVKKQQRFTFGGDHRGMIFEWQMPPYAKSQIEEIVTRHEDRLAEMKKVAVVASLVHAIVPRRELEDAVDLGDVGEPEVKITVTDENQPRMAIYDFQSKEIRAKYSDLVYEAGATSAAIVSDDNGREYLAFNIPEPPKDFYNKLEAALVPKKAQEERSALPPTAAKVAAPATQAGNIQSVTPGAAMDQARIDAMTYGFII